MFTLIRPRNINNVTLLSTNVVDDYSAYNAATTYASGAYVQVDSPSSTVTISNASPGVVTWTAHSIPDDTVIVLTTTGTLPTGLTAGAVYYWRSTGTNTGTVSEKKGGAPIKTTSAGSGTHTATASMHNVYESLQASNTGHTPRSSPTWWLDHGATNKWRMFDSSVTSQSQNAETIEVTVAPGGVANGVALLNVSAGSARFRMRDPNNSATVTMTIASPAVVTETAHTKNNGDMVVFTTTDALPTGCVASKTYYVVNKTTNTYEFSETSGGASVNTTGTQSGVHTVTDVIYDSTYSLVSSDGVSSWFSWFHETRRRTRDIVELEMPTITNPHIDIWLTESGGMVQCGVCVSGQNLEIGEAQLGASTGIQDYSIKQEDAFGNYTILERSFRKRADFQIVVENTRIGYVQNVLSDYRATPIIYVGHEDYTNTIIYGFYKDFAVEISYQDVSILTASIEGLT
jgi:hypothetical protein